MTRTLPLLEEPSFAERIGGAAVDPAKAPDLRTSDARPGLSDETARNFDVPGGFGDLRHSLTTHWKVQQR
jgi:hypothetical protein